MIDDYLTAQEFADELQVTRQLIYYHAKKIPKNEKVYNKENKLVFTAEQQDFLKSFMTDTFGQSDLQEWDENKTVLEDSESQLVRREIPHDPDLAEQIKKVIQPKTQIPLSDEDFTIPNEKNENVSEGTGSTSQKSLPKVKTHSVEETGEADELSEDFLIVNKELREYIQLLVQSKLDELRQQEVKEQEFLRQELSQKNKQINDLLQLLDQQQQLMLYAEKRNQTLTEPNPQLKISAQSTQADVEDSVLSKESILDQKSWLQKLFRA